MLCECMLGVVALAIACAAASNGVMAQGTPFQIFAKGISGFFTNIFGLPAGFSACFITMCVSALGMTTIDSVARIGRMSFQEMVKPSDGVEPTSTQKFLMGTSSPHSHARLCLWPLPCRLYEYLAAVRAANQLLSALVLISLAVFLKMTNRKGWMLYVPMVFMFIVTMTALVMSVYGGGITKLMAGKFLIGVDGLQLVIAIALMILACLVVKHCGKELLDKGQAALGK